MIVGMLLGFGVAMFGVIVGYAMGSSTRKDE